MRPVLPRCYRLEGFDLVLPGGATVIYSQASVYDGDELGLSGVDIYYKSGSIDCVAGGEIDWGGRILDPRAARLEQDTVYDLFHADLGHWQIRRMPADDGTDGTIDMPLRKGKRRGLPGGSSLARLLSSCCGVRNPRQPPKLIPMPRTCRRRIAVGRWDRRAPCEPVGNRLVSASATHRSRLYCEVHFATAPVRLGEASGRPWRMVPSSTSRNERSKCAFVSYSRAPRAVAAPNNIRSLSCSIA